MSPFLTQVKVFNVLGSSEAATSMAGTSGGSPASAESIRALAAQVKAKALANAAKELEDAADRVSSTSAQTAQPTPSRHPKSNDDSDTIFAAIPIVAIVFTFLYLIVKALMAPFNNRNKHAAPASAMSGGLSDEEVATLMKLQRTLVQMESRVEALETILIEQSRSKENYGSKL